jgi:hypothetical protein
MFDHFDENISELHTIEFKVSSFDSFFHFVNEVARIKEIQLPCEQLISAL